MYYYRAAILLCCCNLCDIGLMIMVVLSAKLACLVFAMQLHLFYVQNE